MRGGGVGFDRRARGVLFTSAVTLAILDGFGAGAEATRERAAARPPGRF